MVFLLPEHSLQNVSKLAQSPHLIKDRSALQRDIPESLQTHGCSGHENTLARTVQAEHQPLLGACCKGRSCAQIS